MSENTWMTTVSGILQIIAGALKIISTLGIALFYANFQSSYQMYEGHMWHYNIVSSVAATVPLAIAVAFLVLGGLSLAGGIFTLRRRCFGMALTGSIAALLPASILGIAAVILTALSQKEFKLSGQQGINTPPSDM